MNISPARVIGWSIAAAVGAAGVVAACVAALFLMGLGQVVWRGLGFG